MLKGKHTSNRLTQNNRPTKVTATFKSDYRLKQMKKVDNIGAFYQISYKYFEMLGNGAFGIVRPCRKLRGLDSDIGISSKFSRT